MKLEWKRIDSYIGNSTIPELVLYRPCPICGVADAKPVLELQGFQFFSDSSDSAKRVSVIVNQCRECLALYLNPCYSKYGFLILFKEAGRSYGATEGRPQEQIEWLYSQNLLDDGCRFLDVGCYDGKFLASLPGSIKKVGIDIDEQAIRRGREKYIQGEIDFVLGDFSNFFYEKSIDVISMFHVLEHLPDPVGVLKNLRANAQSSTRLVVEVPIIENGITNDINGFFSVQHMTHFSRSSLANCLVRSGWQIEKIFEHPNYNGCRVLATPGKIVKEVNGNRGDIDRLYQYLTAWYKAVENVNSKLNKIEGDLQCVIWGAGLHTEFLYQLTILFYNKETRFIIVDSDPMKQGKTWRGLQVYHPDKLALVNWANAMLVVSSYGSQKVIVENCKELDVPEERIVNLYDEIRVY